MFSPVIKRLPSEGMDFNPLFDSDQTMVDVGEPIAFSHLLEDMELSMPNQNDAETNVLVVADNFNSEKEEKAAIESPFIKIISSSNAHQTIDSLPIDEPLLTVKNSVDEESLLMNSAIKIIDDIDQECIEKVPIKEAELQLGQFDEIHNAHSQKIEHPLDSNSLLSIKARLLKNKSPVQDYNKKVALEIASLGSTDQTDFESFGDPLILKSELVSDLLRVNNHRELKDPALSALSFDEPFLPSLAIVENNTFNEKPMLMDQKTVILKDAIKDFNPLPINVESITLSAPIEASTQVVFPVEQNASKTPLFRGKVLNESVVETGIVDASESIQKVKQALLLREIKAENVISGKVGIDDAGLIGNVKNTESSFSIKKTVQSTESFTGIDYPVFTEDSLLIHSQSSLHFLNPDMAFESHHLLENNTPETFVQPVVSPLNAVSQELAASVAIKNTNVASRSLFNFQPAVLEHFDYLEAHKPVMIAINLNTEDEKGVTLHLKLTEAGKLQVNFGEEASPYQTLLVNGWKQLASAIDERGWVLDGPHFQGVAFDNQVNQGTDMVKEAKKLFNTKDPLWASAAIHNSPLIRKSGEKSPARFKFSSLVTG